MSNLELQEGDYIIKKAAFSCNREVFIIDRIFERKKENEGKIYLDYKIYVESAFVFNDDKFYQGELNFGYRKLDMLEIEKISNIYYQLKEIWDKMEL